MSKTCRTVAIDTHVGLLAVFDFGIGEKVDAIAFVSLGLSFQRKGIHILSVNAGSHNLDKGILAKSILVNEQ